MEKKGKYKTVIVWGLTFLFIFYIIHTTDLERLFETLKKISLFHYFLITFFAVIISYAYDTFTLKLILKRFITKNIAYRELLKIKGISFLLNIINYNAAVAGISYFVKSKTKKPFLTVLSSMLFLYLIDIFSLALLTEAGYLMARSSIPQKYSFILGSIPLYAIIAVISGITFWKIEPYLKFIHKVSRKNIFSAFKSAKIKDYVWFTLLRLNLIIIYAFTYYLLIKIFKINITFFELLTVYPAIVFIGTLPISVSGIGSTQIASRIFYSFFYHGFPGINKFFFLTNAYLVYLFPFLSSANSIVADLTLGFAAYFSNPYPIIDALSISALSGFLLWRLLIGVALNLIYGKEFIPSGK